MENVIEVSAMLPDGSGALINLDAITIEEIKEEFPENYSLIITSNDKSVKHYAAFVKGSKIYGMDGDIINAEILESGETIEGKYYNFPKHFFNDCLKKFKHNR